MSYAEPLVARVTGIHKATIVAARKAKLTKGDDWTVDRNVVCFTPAGLEKLLACLGVSAAALAWPAAGEGQDSGAEDEALDGAADGAGEALEQPAESSSIVEKIVLEPAGAPPAVGLPGVPFEEPAAAVVAAAVEKIQTADLVELTVRKISHNPTILHAAGADGVVVTVRVTSNANFILGMKLKARPPVEGAVQVYSMVGHCPRWRGRF